MINEEKVRLMTKLTLYEEGKGKKVIPLSGYFREDYISEQMLKSFVAGTLGYGIILALVLLYQVEEIINNFVKLDLMSMATLIIASYAGFIVLYLLLTYIISSIRYKRAKKSLKAYDGILKKVEGIYAREETDTKPIKW